MSLEILLGQSSIKLIKDLAEAAKLTTRPGLYMEHVEHYEWGDACLWRQEKYFNFFFFSSV